MPEHLDRLTDSLARDTSRRGFLARVGGALMAVTDEPQTAKPTATPTASAAARARRASGATRK